MSSKLFNVTVFGVLLCAVAVAAANKCSIHNGKCVYHIALSNENCQGQIQAHSAPLQNDYSARVNQIEHSLDDVREAHARRIQELEQQVLNILRGSGPGNGRHQRGSHSNDIPMAKAADGHENTMLRILQRRFSMLRSEVQDLRKKLRGAAIALNGTKSKLNETEVNLALATRRAHNAEKKISRNEDENFSLRQQVGEQENVLNSTQRQLKETMNQLTETEREMYRSKIDQDKIRIELDHARLSLNETQGLLKTALKKYRDLSVKHDQLHNSHRANVQAMDECNNGAFNKYCSFEDPEICGFIQNNDSDVFDWEVGNKNTPSAHTGPESDHTCDSPRGRYLYIESSARGQGQNAMITSPRFHGKGEQCVEFWYHMYGRHVGTLNVYLQAVGGGSSLLWRGFGNQGNLWIRSRSPVPKEVALKGYKVVFEGATGKGYQGDMAIDDFRIFDGPCVVIRSAADLTKEELAKELNRNAEQIKHRRQLERLRQYQKRHRQVAPRT